MNHQEQQQFYKLLRLSLGLTQEFLVEVDADGWRRLYQTAILKGQANARLYPDKHARQPGDVDIWVEGGRERVLALLPNHPKAAQHRGTPCGHKKYLIEQ